MNLYVITLRRIRNLFIALCILLTSVGSKIQAQQNSLHFDGVDDYVDLGRPPYMTINQTSNFTWEGWIKTTGTDHQTLFSNMWNDASDRGFEIYVQDGQLRLTLSSARLRNEYTEVSTTARVNTGNWTYVAVSLTGMSRDYSGGVAGNIKLYINGVSQTVNTLHDNLLTSFSMYSNQNVIIGMRNGMQYPFNGEIDEMRWWGSVRTASEIAASVSNKCSIQSYDENLYINFDFNQGTGGANNARVTTLSSHGALSGNGTLTNFALDGAGSNWLDASANGIFPDCATANVRFVKPDAPVGGNGLTWKTAYRTLQAALEQVGKAGAPIFTEIWVAKGTYFPDEWTGFDNNRNGYFKLHNNLGIYGGFAGTEGLRSQRKPSANPTILSGEIQQDGNAANNSYHVVANIKNSVTSTAILDGFTITGGYNQSGTGAGMYNEDSSPTVSNCYFTGNTAVNGGAIGNAGSAAPYIVNCGFMGNTASVTGGAIANDANTSANIINCTFSGNEAASGGGAILNQNDYSGIYNSIFWGNGNNAILGNSSNAIVAYSIVQGGYPGSTNINNDPLFVNAAEGNLSLLPCSPAINQGLVNYIPSDITMDITGKPRRYADGIVDIGAYEYQAAPGVALPSAQSPQMLPVNATVADLTASGTKIEWFESKNGAVLDPSKQLFSGTYYVRQSVGACVGPFLEVQVNLYSVTAYVRPAAMGLGNGSSWDNASNDIQAMINKKGIQQLWVATGTYKPSTIASGGYDEKDMSFVLKEGIKLYGGFAGTETQLSERNWETRKTILSGDIGVEGDNSDNVGHVVLIVGSPGNPITPATVLDGFTLTGGNTNNAGAAEINGQDVFNYGGGLFNLYASPTLRNLIISHNTSDYYGGGMYNEYASPTLDNVTISHNSGFNGGGLSNRYYSSPTMTNCSVFANYSERDGGGIFSYYYSSLVITNSSITGNSADRDGGGIYDDSYASPVMITNSTISGNHAGGGGGGLYGRGGSSAPMLTGSLIDDNTADGHGGGIYNTYDLTFAFDRVTLRGNKANSGGGIYNDSQAALDIKNTLITGNKAEQGGGIYNLGGSSIALTNLTFSGNTNYAIHSHDYAGTTVTVKNSLIYGNGNGVHDGMAAATFSHSLVQGKNGGSNGNLDGNVNPIFVNAPSYSEAPFTGGDYTLTFCSQAINSGSDADNITSIDLNGNNRRFGVIDMGAYEVQTAATTLTTNNLKITTSVLSSGTTTFEENCHVLASLKSMGDNPVAGEVTARVWLETIQPAQYVKRHYQITPETGAETATGRVTLYFTQQEFDDFNSVNSVKLPTGSSDAAGIARLLIEKRGGSSTDGSGQPSTYPGSVNTIENQKITVVWNSAASRWEISFDLTGFSGFFVKTTDAALPVRWISFTARLSDDHYGVLDWKVDQASVLGYEIERSSNAKDFRSIGTVTAGNSEGIAEYNFTDPVVATGTVYYRIRQTDLDGSYGYSRIVSVKSTEGAPLTAYPNPVAQKVTVQLGAVYIGTTLKLTNTAGVLLQQLSRSQQTFEVNLDQYPAGVYLLYTWDGRAIKLIKN